MRRDSEARSVAAGASFGASRGGGKTCLEGFPMDRQFTDRPGALTVRRMTEPITPRQLAVELGVSDRTVRQWLRDQGWQSVPYARWELTADQAAQVRTHFRG